MNLTALADAWRLPPGRDSPDQESIAAPASAAAGISLGPLIAAAVLVPILRGADPCVMLTLRAPTLASHAGQVAFPGGRADPTDADLQATALREAWEEIGLPADAVDVIGRLPDHVTGTGFLVSPIVGLVTPRPLRPNPAEVAEVFSLPLRVVLDPAAPRCEQVEWGGRTRTTWVWPHAEHRIWGATAAILVALAARLRALPLS